MDKHTRNMATAFMILLAVTPAAAGTELAILEAANWEEFAPAGKEVDCIYGDYVLRNDQIVAVIARPVPTRNANMTVRNVGAMLIDLTRRETPNDQLSAYYAHGVPLVFEDEQAVVITRDGRPVPREGGGTVRGAEISWQASARSAGGAEVTVRYSLAEGEPHLHIESVIRNPQDHGVDLELRDMIRADRTFTFGTAPAGGLFWANDEWFRQAYGVLVTGRELRAGGNRNAVLSLLRNGSSSLQLQPGEEHRLERRIFPGDHLLEVRGRANRLLGRPGVPVAVRIADPAGPVPHALVTLEREGEDYGSGRTDDEGSLRFEFPPGGYRMRVVANGRPPIERQGEVAVGAPTTLSVELDPCGYVLADIRGESGGSVPCKVGFYGVGGTPDPDFGPDTGEVAVRNLHYSHNGQFRQEILPGRYEVVISYGPEYDAVFREIEVRAGQETPLRATLRRVVDTTGWVSSDFHSHSTPSGDNTSSQQGRVLNLLCEHVEFCPCTEHNRIDSYLPHLDALGVRHLMATCSGIELTGQPLPVNHQNAFPLVHRPRTQDGGGPVTDGSPVVQIERLALWDGGSDKLVQENHPNLVQILGDRDLDGNADGGFQQMFRYMDVVEIHPPADIFAVPGEEDAERPGTNRIVHWMQLLNLGYRIPGVVNTDAHYNFHGSGALRNYLKSSTDDPARIDTMEMVHAAESGQLVMTTGPFLEVSLRARRNPGITATAGDELVAEGGEVDLEVRVQSSNWLDVNRVQVFLNGRAAADANFTRRDTPDRFGNGVVKFEQTIPLSLDRDTHVIVATIGEGLQLGRVMGPAQGQSPPVAVSNPIFVDLQGDGFQANGDLLDLPAPGR